MLSQGLSSQTAATMMKMPRAPKIGSESSETKEKEGKRVRAFFKGAPHIKQVLAVSATLIPQEGQRLTRRLWGNWRPHWEQKLGLPKSAAPHLGQFILSLTGL